MREEEVLGKLASMEGQANSFSGRSTGINGENVSDPSSERSEKH